MVFSFRIIKNARKKLLKVGILRKVMEKWKNKRVPIRLPSDIMIDIMSRLSLKQLSQLQLVSKEWRALTQDHYLIQKHMSRCPVVLHWHNERLPARRIPSHSLRFMHGCDGLILIANKTLNNYYLWNPAIFLALKLPSPHAHTIDQALFYIPSTRDYRIVSLYYKHTIGVGCEVLTLGPSMSWKPLPFPDFPDPLKVLTIPTGGDVHFVFLTEEEDNHEMIVSLDVEAESFTVNHLDGHVFDGVATVLNWDGKLGIVNIVGKTLEVVKLEDYRKGKWATKKTVIPLRFVNTPGFEGSIIPLFNRRGDIWFWLKGKEIFSYTIKTGKILHVKKSNALFCESGLIYSYKPSLLSFEGMRRDTNIDANFEIYRPRCPSSA